MEAINELINQQLLFNLIKGGAKPVYYYLANQPPFYRQSHWVILQTLDGKQWLWDTDDPFSIEKQLDTHCIEIDHKPEQKWLTIRW